MSPHPSTLPPNPSLVLLANLAKRLRKAHAARDSGAFRRFQTHHPKFTSSGQSDIAATEVSLRDTQLVIARECGFENWTALKKHVQSRQDAHISGEDVAKSVSGVTQSIPFFAVSDMEASLEHYVVTLGFRMTNK